jgi:hypothetical protein
MIRNSSFLTKIRTNFNSFEDVELFIQILILATVLPLLIKLLSIPKLMKLLTPRDAIVFKHQDSHTAKEKIVRYTDYILSRRFWIYKMICWKRALVLYRFLRKAGFNVTICFGVRLPNTESKDKPLEGHAWLVYNGEIFLERDIETAKTYKVTYSYPEGDQQILNEAAIKQF